MVKPFTGQFTQQEALPDEAIEQAVRVMRSGRLHRYNVVGDEHSAASSLEAKYARHQGAKYCLACTSGGYAMSLALRAAGVKPGDRVLTNGFTLAPVPGAIAAVGAEPVLVEITSDLVIDLHDLEIKIDSSGSRVLLLSNMRGHLCDMEALAALCERKDVALIEDCAHTMGASWNGKLSGSFGIAGCFSTQTYKHLNSGEGGLLTSDDPEFMARAIILSGSYMLYDRHGAAPDAAYFENIKLDTPNMSGRMDNLRASILIPQLEHLNDNIARWNERYDLIAAHFVAESSIAIAHRPSAESYVGSSIQFRVPGLGNSNLRELVAMAKSLGVDLKWFGDTEPVADTSHHHSWRYVSPQDLPTTDEVLKTLFDIRIPLTFSAEDCAQIAEIIVHCVRSLSHRGAA